MKINWGTGIAIFYICFVVAVLGFVFWTANLSPELVTEDYYVEEQKYQEVIDKKFRTSNLEGVVKIKADNGVIELELPSDLAGKNTKGKLLFYRQDDKSLDKEFEFQGTDLVYRFEYNKLILGLWKAKLSWETDGVDYYYEENLVVR